MSLDLIQRLEAWYSAQCDDDWEHGYGIKIDTVDNPGWAVVIDLTGTSLADVPFSEVKELEPESKWIHCVVKDRRFEGHGGPPMLHHIVGTFMEWAEAGKGIPEERAVEQQDAADKPRA